MNRYRVAAQLEVYLPTGRKQIEATIMGSRSFMETEKTKTMYHDSQVSEK